MTSGDRREVFTRCRDRARSVWVAGAVLMLLGLAGTQSAQARARVSLSTASSATVGAKMTVSGRISGGGRANRVLLQRQIGRSWRQLAAGKPSRAGRYRVVFTVPAGSRLTVRIVARRGPRVVAISLKRRLTLRAKPGLPAGPPTTSGPVAIGPVPAGPAGPAGLPPLTTSPAPSTDPATSLAQTPTSAVSDGGVTKVALGALTVTAPAGAIAEGQTLEVRRGRPPGVPDHGLTSLIGGAIDVTTSQGQPSAPVALRVAVPATALSDGSEPLLLHGDGQVVRWLPEPSTFSADTLIATVSSFSPIDIVDSVTYAGGLLTGDRTDLPSDCQPGLPSWIDAETLPHTDKNGALPLCLADGTNEQQAKVRLVNNRGYAQTVRVTGATFAISGSGFQQSLEQQIAEAYARRASPSDPQRFVIAPGGSVVLTFPRPEETPTAQLVRFSVESQQWTGLAAIAWSIATITKDEIGLPVAAVDCLIGGLYNVASTDAGLDSGLGRLRACGDVAVGFADQAKRKVWKRLTAGLAVNSVAFKYFDSQADAVYPPEMTFTIGGSGEVDSGVVISPNDLGTVENAKTTTVQLTATGADEPYVFRLRAIGGAWPDWVTLEPSGLLTITPPAGTSGQYTLYAYTRQPNGRHSAYALNPIIFSIAAPPAPPTPVVSSPSVEQCFTAKAANDGSIYHTCVDDVSRPPLAVHKYDAQTRTGKIASPIDPESQQVHQNARWLDDIDANGQTVLMANHRDFSGKRHAALTGDGAFSSIGGEFVADRAPLLSEDGTRLIGLGGRGYQVYAPDGLIVGEGPLPDGALYNLLYDTDASGRYLLYLGTSPTSGGGYSSDSPKELRLLDRLSGAEVTVATTSNGFGDATVSDDGNFVVYRVNGSAIVVNWRTGEQTQTRIGHSCPQGNNIIAMDATARYLLDVRCEGGTTSTVTLSVYDRVLNTSKPIARGAFKRWDNFRAHMSSNGKYLALITGGSFHSSDIDTSDDVYRFVLDGVEPTP